MMRLVDAECSEGFVENKKFPKMEKTKKISSRHPIWHWFLLYSPNTKTRLTKPSQDSALKSFVWWGLPHHIIFFVQIHLFNKANHSPLTMSQTTTHFLFPSPLEGSVPQKLGREVSPLLSESGRGVLLLPLPKHSPLKRELSCSYLSPLPRETATFPYEESMLRQIMRRTTVG